MNTFTKLNAAGVVLPADADLKEVSVIRIDPLGIEIAPFLLNKGKPADWKKARKLAATLEHGGHKDWRLPEVEEAFLIPDRSKCDPAVDTTIFPFLKDGGWLWTNTPAAWSPASFAWLVSLDLGSAYSYPQFYVGLVLAVRGPVASAGQ